MPSKLEYRDAAKAFLAYVCDELVRRGAIAEEEGHQVVSAFVEAFNNAVCHGGTGNRDAEIEVRLRVHLKSLELCVIDVGAGFDPTAIAQPDLDALPEHGMGLFIMRSFMDSVEYSRESGRNILTMQKALGG